MAQGELGTALLLVGGLGTRLRPLTYETPKPLVPVANRPLIWYPLEMLRRAGVRHAILACGYKANRLREGMARAGDWGLGLSFVEEDRPLGTAGGIGNAAHGLSQTFVAMNGDQILDLDLGAVLAEHRRRRATATIVLRRVADVSAYGLVLCDDDLRVERFVEKVREDPTGRNLVNSGVYVFEPRVLDYVPAGVPLSNEYDLFPTLIAEGEAVLAYPMPEGAYWADVGRPGNYLAANAAILHGALPWAAAEVSPAAEVARGAEITAPVSLAPGCRVAPRAEVGPATSLGAGAVVHADAVVRNSIVWPEAEIGEGAVLDQVIVGPGHRVAPGTITTGPTILAPTDMESAQHGE